MPVGYFLKETIVQQLPTPQQSLKGSLLNIEIRIFEFPLQLILESLI